MPTDFCCPLCSLKFSVGPFHFHNFDAGYAGCRLLVCTSCGTQHGLEAALRDRGSEFNCTYRVTALTVPDATKVMLASWLHRYRKIALHEALAIVRQPPFVVAKDLWKHEVAEIEAAIESLGVGLSVTEAERIPNPMFGPLLPDRLRFSAGPAFGEEMEWSGSIELSGWTTDESLVCQCCKATGTLVWQFDAERKCPACKQGAVGVEREWTT